MRPLAPQTWALVLGAAALLGCRTLPPAVTPLAGTPILPLRAQVERFRVSAGSAGDFGEATDLFTRRLASSNLFQSVLPYDAMAADPEVAVTVTVQHWNPSRPRVAMMVPPMLILSLFGILPGATQELDAEVRAADAKTGRHIFAKSYQIRRGRRILGSSFPDLPVAMLLDDARGDLRVELEDWLKRRGETRGAAPPAAQAPARKDRSAEEILKESSGRF